MKRMLALVLCFGLLAGLFAGCRGRADAIPEIDAETFTVTPSAQADGLIPTDAGMRVIFGGKKLSARDALKVFRFDPPVEFAAEAEDGGLVLKPSVPFEQNAVITLEALDPRGRASKSWAFQTATGFAVKSTLPRDGESYVPETTGIEVTFTYPNVSAEAFGENFTLTDTRTGKAVAGRAEKYADTLVFVPASPLSLQTAYEGVLSGELCTDGGTVLGQDCRIRFNTAYRSDDGSYHYRSFENDSPVTETFLTGDAPILAVRADEAFDDAAVDVSMYRYPDAQAYAAQLADYAARRGATLFSDCVAPQVDTGSLTQLGAFQTKLQKAAMQGYDAYDSQRFIALPGEFTPGWYYIRAAAVEPESGEERVIHKFIQVCDLSVYYAQVDGETLFWLNDAETGEPVSGAEVTLAGAVSASGQSGKDGVARLTAALPDAPGEDEKRADDQCVLTVRRGDDVFIDLYTAKGNPEPTPRERYVSYLYTDRPIYMSTDTVRVWGVLRPRAGSGAPAKPENLRLALGGYSAEDRDWITIPVEVAPEGTFTGEIPFERLGGQTEATRYISLLCGENDILAERWVEIGDYVKPTYVPAFTKDKPVYRAGENAKLTFSASFFDGTPASNFSANYEIRSRFGSVSPEEGTLVTGEDGSVSQMCALGDVEGDAGWRPESIFYSASNAGGENVNFSIYSHLSVLYRDLALRGTVDMETNNVRILTNRVDTSRIENDDDLYDDDNLIGEPVDAQVAVELRKTFYTQEAVGSYYNFVAKRNETRYNYIRHDEIVSTSSYRTQNGVYNLGDLPRSDADATYYLVLRAPDGQGRTVSEKVWLGYEDYYYNEGVHKYSFSKRCAEEDYQVLRQFTEDEDTFFDVRDNGRAVESGRILYLTAGKTTEYGVSDRPEVRLPFKEDLVPNYKLCGAFFDGRHIYKITGPYMEFDPATRKLAIKVATDREQYAPGGDAKVDVTVTSARDGKPAAGAAVSLSLVDEAVFAIREDSAEPLETLYDSVYDPKINVFASYIEYNFGGNMGGEKGGGGGDEGVRSDFKDTAVFLTATADAEGRARFDIPLPDNITTWRATVHAVDDSLFAGAVRAPVVVTGRFYLNDVLPSQFLSGDSASVTLRSYGSAVSPEDRVDYTVTVEGNGQKREETASGAAKDLVSVPLGSLQKGTYKITMAAQSGGVQDAVEKTVEVADSGVEAWLARTVDVADGIDIEPEKFPVEILFYNEDYRLYADVLDHLLSTSSGARTDERIARRYAGERIAELRGDEEKAPVTDTLSDVLASGGSATLFSYASSSVTFAARVHLAAPDYLMGGDATDFFYNAVGRAENMKDGGGRADLAAAYLGLAAHREPVLNRVRAMLLDTRLTDKERLYLTAALAALGDTDGAREAYAQNVQPKLARGQTPQDEETVYMDLGGNIVENIEYTALASLTASLLEMPDADGMMRYLIHNRSTLDLYLLEEIVYLRHNAPAPAEKASVSFRRGGKTETLKLGELGMRSVKFFANDFKDADIRARGGSVRAKVFYTGAVADAASLDPASCNAKLTRKLEVVGGGEMKTGSVVRVTLTPTLPLDTIDPYGTVINDYIPSGMRFLSMVGDRDVNDSGKWLDTPWQLVRREGQRISFWCWQNGLETEYDDEGNEIQPPPAAGEQKYPAMKPLVYYVRCAAPGDYVVDSAFVRSNNSPDWGLSDKTRVTIGA